MINAYDKAIKILQTTNDGNDLSPEHLKLLEIAVNGWLSEQGEVAFDALYQNVLQGYKKPYFHNIKHLTIDHEGYVYWKSVPIEHYNPSWAFSTEAKVSAIELAKRCRYLEAFNIPVTTRSAIWNWDNFLILYHW